ncbi:MAG: PQQ-dependent sugar dehydrogenase [Labilithrix sp.]
MLERSRSFAFTLLLSSSLLGGVIAACSSDDTAGPGGDGGASSGTSGASGTSSGDVIDGGSIELPDGHVVLPDGGEIPDGEGPPGPKRDFPLDTPELGGYALEEYFPATMKMTIPAAVGWTANPLVLERIGNVIRMESGKRRNVLDFTADVALQSEGGALGMALHPQFGDGSGPKPYAYFWYNAKGATKNEQRLVRYTWSAASQSFDPASKLVMIEEEEEHPEHNAGRMAFGKDGLLYLGNGDDLNDANHQTLNRALFAGIFRIDVDSDAARSHPIPKQPAGGFTTGYMIPNDNPFVGQGGLEEFYALGFRNPFMFSFDRQTNDLWVGDVGDSFREEINRVEKGGNYQWPVREGELVRQAGKTITIGTSHDPESFYTHHEMGDLTAIFGGFVYRGKALPELNGKYIYSDWPSDRIWAYDPATKTRATIVSNQWDRQPMAMTEDNDGEIYLLHYTGVAKLVKDSAPLDVPKRLLETKIFKDLATMTVEDGFVPYAINSPLWSDGASKQRWISVPAGQKVTVKEDGTLAFPVGTRFVKQFDLPDTVQPRGRTKHLETRVLVVGNATTYGLSYRWNAAGTDATLAPEGFDETITDDASGSTRVWHTPSFGQCWQCHRAENRVLGFTQKQTSRDGQPQMFADKGLFDANLVAGWPAPLTQPTDTGKSLEERALAYLAANCSGCHHEGASYTGGGQTWIASPGVALSARGLVNVPNHNYPVAAGLGLTQGSAPLIEPGDPSGSLLVRRLQTDDHDLMMPPLGKNIVDVDGAKLVSDWVASMPPAP